MTESYRADPHRETLSAAVDGELSKEELRFLLRRLDHGAELQQAWSRYHLVRDGLRRELPAPASAGFAARVALAVEQISSAEVAQDRRRHWLRWSAGGAIAASVAVAALMVARPAGDDGEHALKVASRTPAAAVGPAPAMVAAAPNSLAPANVPGWLSSNSAMRLSQPASATLGGPDDDAVLPYSSQLRPYQMQRYRAVRNGDGSYLLLIDPDQTGRADGDSQQAPATLR